MRSHAPHTGWREEPGQPLPTPANPGQPWPTLANQRRLVRGVLARVRAVLGERAHVDEMAGDGRGRCHLWGDEVRAPAIALSALEIAVLVEAHRWPGLS